MAPPSAAVAGGEAAGRHLAAPPYLGPRAGSVRLVPLPPRENELSGFVLNNPEVEEQTWKIAPSTFVSEGIVLDDLKSLDSVQRIEAERARLLAFENFSS